MKKQFTLSFLLLTFVAQAQVIPVGFIKKGGYPSTGENPVTTNLLLYLDATRSASFDGTSTTAWKDISGQSNHATLTGSANPYTPAPAFTNNNSFTFTANTFALTTNSLSFLDKKGTFIAWINPSKTHTEYTGIIFSRTAMATGLNLYNSNNSVGYHWHDAGSTWGWNSNLQVPNDEWSMIAVSIGTNSATAYLCKSTGITTATNTVTHSATSGHQFHIAVDPGAKAQRTFIGKIATSMVYSTELSTSQITQIFNAQKAAFGL